MSRRRFPGSIAAMVPLLFLLGCSGMANGIANRFTGEDAASQIRATGSPAKATVVAIWETGTRVNNNPVVGFDLEVHAEGRPAWRAKTKALVSILAIPRIQPGAVLDVFYDPADSSRVAIASHGRSSQVHRPGLLDASPPMPYMLLAETMTGVAAAAGDGSLLRFVPCFRLPPMFRRQ